MIAIGGGSSERLIDPATMGRAGQQSKHSIDPDCPTVAMSTGTLVGDPSSAVVGDR